jgi:hypothetical protein
MDLNHGSISRSVDLESGGIPTTTAAASGSTSDFQMNEQTPLLTPTDSSCVTTTTASDTTAVAAAAVAAVDAPSVSPPNDSQNGSAEDNKNNEAIPATSVKQTAMSGFAGLGCMYILYASRLFRCFGLVAKKLSSLLFFVYPSNVFGEYGFFGWHVGSCIIVSIHDDGIFCDSHTTSIRGIVGLLRYVIITLRSVSTK